MLGITDQLATNLQTYVQSGMPTPAAPAPAPNGSAFADGEYVSGAELNRQAPRLIDDRIQPHIQQMNETMASFALDRIKSEHAAEFERYGPEIYGYLSRLDKKAGAWTVDNLKQVVKMVRADHVDEIVRDKLHAQSPMEPALRSTGAAPVSVTPSSVDLTLASEKLPAEYREKLKAAGVTESTFDEFLRGSGQDRESFFKLFDKKMVITEAPRI